MRRFFIDIDGVLADFWSAAVRLFGVDPDTVYQDVRDQYDMTWLTGGCAHTFWQAIEQQGSKFWSTLPLYDHAHQLVDAFEDPILVTASTYDPYCYKGKVEWIRRHFPDTPKIFISGNERQFLAGKNRVLIDDCPLNIDYWQCCGGTAIQFRRPGTSFGLTAEEAINELR